MRPATMAFGGFLAGCGDGTRSVPATMFDEREMETEQGRAREAPPPMAHERAGRIGPLKPPRHFSTLLSLPH